MEGVAGEEDHHDDQEEQGEEPAEAEGQHDEHDEDGKDPMFGSTPVRRYAAAQCFHPSNRLICSLLHVYFP